MTDPAPPVPVAEPKPTLSERDASWYEANAGIAAREAANAQGADPAHLKALLLPLREPLLIRGEKLHNTALLVTQCFLGYEEMFGLQPQQPLAEVFDRAATDELRFTAAQMRALSHLGFIFTKPLDAYDLLSSDLSDTSDPTGRAEVKAKLRRVFDRAAVAHSAEWTESDFAILIAHLVRQAAARSELDVGKSRPAASPAMTA